MAKDYTFEVAFYKTIKAPNLDTALDILNDKTTHLNECKKITLMEEE